jgi:hypothetical protein
LFWPGGPVWSWFLSPQPLPGRLSEDVFSCGVFTTGGDGVLTTGGVGVEAAGGVTAGGAGVETGGVGAATGGVGVVTGGVGFATGGVTGLTGFTCFGLVVGFAFP